MKFNEKGKLEAINSIVGEGTTFKGEITSPGSVHVAGEVIGGVRAGGDVFVVGKGQVRGDVTGEKIVVSGIVHGNILSRQGLEILKTGKVNGAITCDKLLIEEGSVYRGKVNVTTPDEIKAIWEAGPPKEETENPSQEQTIVQIKDV